MRFNTTIAIASLACFVPWVQADPVTPGITYEGTLMYEDGPYSGITDMAFGLWTAEVGGTLLTAVNMPGTTVTDGRFAVELPFDLAFFSSGEERYIEVTVDDDAGVDDKFIDIRTDAEKSAEEEEEETDPRDAFGVGVDGDETGRNMAYQCFKKIEGNIIDAYELLSDNEDQELFYDYLIANLKLYFDKFEGELAVDVEEPTNQAYDMAKTDAAAETEIPSDPMGLQEYINSL